MPKIHSVSEIALASDTDAANVTCIGARPDVLLAESETLGGSCGRTRIEIDWLRKSPVESVAVKTAAYVPACAYVCVAVVPGLVAHPSPKSPTLRARVPSGSLALAVNRPASSASPEGGAALALTMG